VRAAPSRAEATLTPHPSAWLLDCIALFPPTTQFYGFDITPAHFPAARDIPSNIQLRQRDILAPDVPDNLVGSFDIVHIRAFGSVIRDSDCAPMLQAVNRLLKPGGWVQWEEADSSAMVAVGGDSGAASSTTLLRVLEAGGRARGTTFEYVCLLDSWLDADVGRWFANLRDQVAAAGFRDTDVLKFPLLSEQYKAWTEDYLLVYEEIAHMLPSEKDMPGAPMTSEKYEALFNQVLKETSDGAVIHSQHLIAVLGQKAA